MSKRTLIIIPTYKEHENIAALVCKIFERNPSIDILVMDDSPDDATANEVRRVQERYGEKLQLVARKSKQGRGSAVLDGFRMALEQGYDLVFEMDADFSHEPEEIQLFLDKMGDCDCVVGSRYLPKSEIRDWGWKRTLFSKWANRFARLVLRIPLSDYTNGYRCYTHKALEALDLEKIDARGYVVLSEVAYQLHRKGFKIDEVPTIFVNRKRGESNFGFQEISEAFTSVLRIRSPHLSLHAQQIAKFILCGLTGAFIDLGSLTIFVEVFYIDPEIAFIPSTLLAVIFVFFFNKNVTFKSHGENLLKQAIKFIVVYTFAVVLNIALSLGLYWFGLYYLLAKAIAIGVIAVMNYILSHSFIFSKR